MIDYGKFEDARRFVDPVIEKLAAMFSIEQKVISGQVVMDTGVPVPTKYREDRLILVNVLAVDHEKEEIIDGEVIPLEVFEESQVIVQVAYSENNKYEHVSVAIHVRLDQLPGEETATIIR